MESQLWIRLPKLHYELKEKVEEEIDSLKFSIEHYDELQQALEFIEKMDESQNR
ncbi:MAG: hypothetical protein ABIM82_06270 [candidate division WOR-3 bacterium]